MTLVNVNATIDAGEAAPTSTLEAVNYIDATAAICAWLRQAEVDSLVTQGARITGSAFALILINAVEASATVLARISMTIVDVLFTFRSLETFRAMAFVLIAFECRALPAVHARIRIAVLHLKLTLSPAKAHRALAFVSLTRVAASGPVQTWPTRTCLNLRFAVLSNPTVTTLACVAVVKDAGIINTCSIIQAWIHGAVFHFNFTVGAEIAGRTFACVGALAGVGAGAAVEAWLVIGAEIEVLVAEQATPALLAVAFPLGIAGSMYTSWVQFTLVTSRSPVSAFASVGEEDEMKQNEDN